MGLFQLLRFAKATCMVFLSSYKKPVQNMKKLIILLLLLLSLPTYMSAQFTVGSGGAYSTLSDAFTAINEGDLTGNITLQIISSITETIQ
ncbi:MAG: hypothetical protein C0408_07675, partial [Odoribacter sp.]|nr:hypothetical protein [Odoribacter sp.]